MTARGLHVHRFIRDLSNLRREHDAADKSRPRPGAGRISALVKCERAATRRPSHFSERRDSY